MGQRSGLQARLVSYGVLRWLSKVFLVLGLLASPALAQPVTILALGDSLTQGYGVALRDGFVPQLQAALRDDGLDVTVINGGVSGDTTAGGLARVDWSLTPDVDVMIVALGGNDLLRGIDPAVARANLTGILQAGRQRDVDMLVIGMEAPGNYGPDYKAEFDAIYPELSQEFGTAYVPSFFRGLLAGGTSVENLTDLMQGDGIHPNAAGVARIVADLAPDVAALVTLARE